jgi:hypothetical protein
MNQTRDDIPPVDNSNKGEKWWNWHYF